MNAQDAAESDQTRPADASPKQRPAADADGSPRAASPAPLKETSVPDKTAKSQATTSEDAVPDTVRVDGNEAAAAEDRDSDAETIVLPGKDGHSPSKARKVRQEDKTDGDADAGKRKDSGGKPAQDGKTGDSTRKKRMSISGGSSLDKDRRPRNKDAGSSGLSSAPASPHDRTSRRRRSDAARSSGSDSDESQHKVVSKTPLQGRHKFGDRVSSQKRKASKGDSDDDGEARKPRRQRTTSAGVENGRALKDGRKQDSRQRSPSPHHRQHRRSVSNQLGTQPSNGLNAKKRRLPPPLQPTDYQSDDSSTGGSPAPRSSKLRGASAGNTHEHASPAKSMPNKKHLDAHGQTLLARACARGEYEGAKQRLRDRPEDLNVADYAGNTPLQIAAINGCEDIVQLLVDAGCNLDCVNYDKDTPLLDAVDNGHLGVVKLLLDAGVNPRKANVNGEEPIDRVDEDTENGDEIRAALMAAKKRAGDRRRTSEDHHSHTDNAEGRDSHAPDSPRHSPAATSGLSGRRSGTVRSTKTRNDLLYMPLDDKTLRQAAGRGDEETVARILQVKEGYDDPEAMVAAARGGHDLVIQLLLGLGGANADPAAVSSLPGEFATPIRAAIGQENIKVVELLLEQQGFDPTRRYRGETYYEIARRRQGTNWKEEEHLLKNAYDEYKRSHKDTVKTRSPTSRRDRERAKDDSKRKPSSGRVDSPQEKRRSNSMSTRADDDAPKRVLPKRADSDAAGMSSDGEAAKPRRKLVSKAELRGERDKRRVEPDAADKSSLSEKYHDRARALKRDESKSAGDNSGKRHRGSATPDHTSDVDKDSNSESAPAKRRRLDADGQENRQKRVPSADARQRKPAENATKSKNSDSSVKVKVEHDDVSMPDLEHAKNGEADGAGNLEEEAVKKKEPDTEQEKSKKSEIEEQKRSKKKKKEEEEAAAAAARKAEEEEAKKRQEQKEREAAEAARKAEEQKKQKEKEEAERKQRDEEERKRKEQLEREAAEEAKRQREEEERKERERRERAHREEMERKRAAREAEQKRIREEQERARLEKLPGLLRWLVVHPSPKTGIIAEKFKQMLGVRYDTIRPEATGTSEGREQWILSTHAALLLGEKDMDLSRYTAWERAPVSQLAKVTLWRTEWPRYSLLAENLWDLGRQLPGYYGDDDPSALDFGAKQQLKTAAWEKFQALELFFVKVRDRSPLVVTLHGSVLHISILTLLMHSSPTFFIQYQISHTYETFAYL